ncbi:hypothetical protein V4V35_23730 [Bacillus infantis]|uniref:hypothetical protein n=1 Tax=Bacillus infantis TaxID=324767 RepID=UPI002FBE1CBE
MKLNKSEAAILIGGRLVPPGTFYNAPEESFITTDNPSGETLINGISEIPEYDKITAAAMKEQLTAWEVDFSDHDKDKRTLYDFYVSELVKRDDAGSAD